MDMWLSHTLSLLTYNATYATLYAQ